MATQQVRNIINSQLDFLLNRAEKEIRNELPFVGGTLQALAQLDTIRKMKKNGCTRPSIIPQSQWDQG